MAKLMSYFRVSVGWYYCPITVAEGDILGAGLRFAVFQGLR